MRECSRVLRAQLLHLLDQLGICGTDVVGQRLQGQIQVGLNRKVPFELRLRPGVRCGCEGGQGDVRGGKVSTGGGCGGGDGGRPGGGKVGRGGDGGKGAVGRSRGGGVGAACKECWTGGGVGGQRLGSNPAQAAAGQRCCSRLWVGRGWCLSLAWPVGARWEGQEGAGVGVWWYCCWWF